MRGGLVPSRAAVSVMLYSPSARGWRVMSLCWWMERAARSRQAASTWGGERDRPLPGGSLACGEVAAVDPVFDGLDGDAEFRGGLGDGELCVAGCRRVADFV